MDSSKFTLRFNLFSLFRFLSRDNMTAGNQATKKDPKYRGKNIVIANQNEIRITS